MVQLLEQQPGYLLVKNASSLIPTESESRHGANNLYLISPGDFDGNHWPSQTRGHLCHNSSVNTVTKQPE